MYVQYGHLHIVDNHQAQNYSVYMYYSSRVREGQHLYALPIFVRRKST